MKKRKSITSKRTQRDQEIRKAWADVVSRRVQNFLAGKAKTTPSEEALADLRARHRRNQAQRRGTMTVVPAGEVHRSLSKVLDKITDEKPVLVTKRGDGVAVLVSPDWYLEHVAQRRDVPGRRRRVQR